MLNGLAYIVFVFEFVYWDYLSFSLSFSLTYTSVESSCREMFVMLLMSSVGGMPGLTEPLASRPTRQLPLATMEMGLGVGGVAVAGLTRNGELIMALPMPPVFVVAPPLVAQSNGLKLPWE